MTRSSVPVVRPLFLMPPKISLTAAVVIRVAPNLIDNIIDQLKNDTSTLRECSLVSKVWRVKALRWLFEVIVVRFAANMWSYMQWTREPIAGVY